MKSTPYAAITGWTLFLVIFATVFMVRREIRATRRSTVSDETGTGSVIWTNTSDFIPYRDSTNTLIDSGFYKKENTNGRFSFFAELPTADYDSAYGWSAQSAPGDTNYMPYSADFAFFTNGVTVLEVTRDYRVKAYGKLIGQAVNGRWVPEETFSRNDVQPLINALVALYEANACVPSDSCAIAQQALDYAGTLGF